MIENPVATTHFPRHSLDNRPRRMEVAGYLGDSGYERLRYEHCIEKRWSRHIMRSVPGRVYRARGRTRRKSRHRHQEHNYSLLQRAGPVVDSIVLIFCNILLLSKQWGLLG